MAIGCLRRTSMRPSDKNPSASHFIPKKTATRLNQKTGLNMISTTSTLYLVYVEYSVSLVDINRKMKGVAGRETQLVV